jgi:galactonate dehydratase
MFNDVPWRDQVIDHPIEIRNGYFILSERPGLGVDLVPAVMEAHPGIVQPRAGFYI